MSRKRQLLVKRRKALPLRQKKLIAVKEINICKSPPGLSIEIQFLDADQFGRSESILLPPLFTDGSSAELFRSLGMDVTEGKKIELDQAVGKLTYIIWDSQIPSISYHNVTFSSQEEGVSNDQSTE